MLIKHIFNFIMDFIKLSREVGDRIRNELLES